jgi:hypothetical protein
MRKKRLAHGSDERMGVSEDVKINKKFVREHLSPEAYRTVYAWYERLHTQLQRTTEVPHGVVTEASALSQSTPAPAGEAPTASPSPAASSSADSGPQDAAERDRQRLRAEVAAWDLRVSPAEIEHIITHHPYSKARTLLWQARRSTSDATPIEAVAD